MSEKRKILLIAGCSHAAGSEIDGTLDSVYNRSNSFGNILASKLNRQPINIAIHGATNSGILRSILNWFDQCFDCSSMDVFVLVAWTESSRIEVPAKNRKFDYFTPGGSLFADWNDITVNDYHKINYGWKGQDSEEKELISYYHTFMSSNQSMLEIWTANFILELQFFFKYNNIKYLMCDTMTVFTQSNHYIKLIENSCYYNFNKSQNDTFYWKYHEMGYKNERAKYWHHGKEPHLLYAVDLLNFMGEKDV